jgi:hypothetical protein
LEFLKQQHRVQPSIIWERLLQNSPSPLQGTFFQSEWLKTYRPPPREQMRTYLAVRLRCDAERDRRFHGHRRFWRRSSILLFDIVLVLDLLLIRDEIVVSRVLKVVMNINVIGPP